MSFRLFRRIPSDHSNEDFHRDRVLLAGICAMAFPAGGLVLHLDANRPGEKPTDVDFPACTDRADRFFGVQ